jgi:hypothetical protein
VPGNRLGKKVSLVRASVPLPTELALGHVQK